MRSINKVIIIGNLTRDPEMRTTPSGQNVTTFGVATNRQWTTREGDKKNSAEFHECVAWAKLAEICNTYLKKGALVYVEGYLKTRSWETPEGVKKFKTEIVMQDMIMLEKKGDDDGDYLPEGDDASADEDSTPALAATEKAEDPAPEAAPAESTPEQNEEKPAETSSATIDIDKDLGL